MRMPRVIQKRVGPKLREREGGGKKREFQPVEPWRSPG